MSRGSLLVLSVLAVPFVGGCSMIRGNHAEFKPVSDTDFARLQPNQLGPVDQARTATFAAKDDVARAKLRLQEAQNEIDLARADQTAARAAQQRAQAEGDAARSSNDPDAKARAQEDAAQAILQARSAQAHMAYAQRLAEARQAEVDAAGQEVKVRDAELDRARLTALTQAGVPAAAKYDPATFDARVASAQSDYSQRRADADQRLHTAQQDENAWRTLHAQYQDRVRGQTATGSGAAADGVPPPQVPPPARPPPPGPPAQDSPAPPPSPR